MHPFNYHRPSSLAEAAALHSQADDPVYLAGGQTLIPAMRQRLSAPTDVIDLAGLEELRDIQAANGAVRLGAGARHAEVAASGQVRSAIPALAALAGGIGDAQVRNLGTIGGSVANSDPAADYPAALLALNAKVHTDRRHLAADAFFKSLFETALEAAEIITAIEFPTPRRAAYRKFPNPASRYALVGVMVAEFNGAIRVGVTGAGPCAFRARAIEEALAADLRPEALDALELPDAGFNSDLHASAQYRAHLIKIMAKRAVRDLLAMR